MEDWKRTKGVDVKVDNGKVELLLPTDDTLEQIVKAVPESLAEEIILAVENAEAIPEPVTEEELAEELAQESAEELAQEGVETATEIAAEESAEGLTKHYVDPKDIDAAEKTTMGQLRDAIKTTGRASKMVGQGKNRRSVAIPATNLGFLEVPLADPTIKLAVSLLRPHYTEAHTDTSTDSQACAAIDRPAHFRPRGLVCLNREQPLHSRQVQARAREARQDKATQGVEEIGQRYHPRSQANTNPQAQGGWQMEGNRGGADQQRSSYHWQQVPGRKDHQPHPLMRVRRAGEGENILALGTGVALHR
jgi:hypothetical protein